MKYCALNNGFYRDNTPDDKIPGSVVHISDDEGKRILDSQINGRIQPGDDGFPVLVPYPELTKDEQQERAEQQRLALINEAMQSISVIQLKMQSGRTLTENEVKRRDSVLDYIDELESIDISCSLNIILPTPPENE
ncbi:tail fiber assembly protein [Enterobacter roggenkampii]|uniref:tail fiber assembly protein n=1 Tax=Enterobacter roggenkampii TaxID=1812935 RepID=UPI002FFC41F0